MFWYSDSKLAPVSFENIIDFRIYLAHGQINYLSVTRNSLTKSLELIPCEWAQWVCHVSAKEQIFRLLMTPAEQT